MGIKKLSIIVLMITLILILTNKCKAVENIEEEKQYNLNQEIKTRILPLMYSKEKSESINGNVTVTEILNDWCKIENAEDSGWVRLSKLKEITTENNTENPVTPETPNETEPTNQEDNNENEEQPINQEDNNEEGSTNQEDVKELNKTGYVSSDGLNIRTEPNTSSEIIHSFSYNARVTITGEIGDWYRIDYEDQIGYVSKKYISDTRLPETTSRGGIDRTKKNNSNETVETKTESSNNENNKEEQTAKQENSSSNSKVTGAQVVEYAKQYIGYKYKSGGATPTTGFDCSGFTSYVFKQFGISLNRSSSGQIKNGIAVNKNDWQQGDILVYKNESKTAIGHVGIYIGNGNFIHSANKKEGVKITSTSSSYYSQRYVGARRVI